VTKLIVDTGPLVALIREKDRQHTWVKELLAEVSTPLQTCESVISEACFLLHDVPGGRDAVVGLLVRGFLRCDFHLSTEAGSVKALMNKFADVPMSLADACLVRMTELQPRSTVITFDSDFRIYRRNHRQIVPTLMP
jgi:predicted nucleic acid-binding protein